MHKNNRCMGYLRNALTGVACLGIVSAVGIFTNVNVSWAADTNAGQMYRKIEKQVVLTNESRTIGTNKIVLQPGDKVTKDATGKITAVHLSTENMNVSCNCTQGGGSCISTANTANNQLTCQSSGNQPCGSCKFVDKGSFSVNGTGQVRATGATGVSR